jgi:PAS domain-containing protein
VGDALLVSFNDIHDQYEAKRRLEEQAALLQQVVNQSPSGMMLLEAVRDETNKIVDFRYLITNELNAKMMGFTVDQMTGQLVSSLFPGYQTIELFNTLVYVAETGETIENTFTYDHFGLKGTFDGYYIKQGDGVLFTVINITRLQREPAAVCLYRQPRFTGAPAQGTVIQ